MLGRQHTNFKSRLLATLFLFFNCVCTAAPVLKLTTEDVISIGVVQTPGPLENEEENRASSYFINNINHILVRKHRDNHFCNSVITNITASVPAIKPSFICIPDTTSLPLPGNYAFLFRYTPF